MDRRLTRRRVLAAAGAGTAALAGCVGDDDGNGTTGGDAGDDGDWREVTVEDVTTGETFSVAEVDQPVVLHTFATWCTTCQSQQENLVALHERRGDDVTMLDLTVDENDDPDDVAGHAERNGFDWRFGVAPAELTSGLVDEIGDAVVVAPQAPVVVVCPDGTAHDLGKGISADTVEETVDSECA